MTVQRHAPARRGRALAAGLCLGLALTGCVQVPTSSPVGTSEPTARSGDKEQAPLYRPPAPSEGADAGEIVRGFLAAGVGPQDDYAVAREYLTAQARRSWDPGKRTVVYSAQPTVTQADEKGQYVVQVEVDSIVDEHGVRTVMPAGTTEAWQVEVTEVDGQKRVSSTEDGTLLSATQFTAIYAPHNLYFFDQTMTYAVPDVRWFINRGTTAGAVMQALLEGPSEPLRGAVVSAFPPGAPAGLTRPSVPVSAGTAEVDLTGQTVEGADPARLARMRQQIELTLTGLGTVEEVDITIEHDPLGVQGSRERAPEVETELVNDSVQVGVSKDDSSLMFFQGLTVTPVGGLPEVSELAPVDPTMNRSRTDFAFLTEDRDELYVATTEGTLERTVEGESLTSPSIDGLDWVWTADTGADSQVRAVPPAASEKNQPRVISTPWLDSGEQIVDLRVAPDGARAALLIDDGEKTRLVVAGVVRGTDGVPSALTEPEERPTTVPMTQVRWVDGVTLVVADTAESAQDEVEPEMVSLDGTRRVLTPLLGMTDISVGGSGGFYAETKDGVSLLVGSSWRSQDVPHPIRDISSPG